MAFNIEDRVGSFRYASNYANGFTAAQPIEPGDDLSSAYTKALGGDALQNFQSGADAASAGIEGLAKRRQAKELAQSYLNQAKSVREAADAARKAAARKRNAGGIGGLLGTIAGGIFGGPIGASIGGAIGGGIGGLF